MVYGKQYWEDYPLTSSPLMASRLNYMEEGIYQASLVPNGDTTGVAITSVSGTVTLSTIQPATFVLNTTANTTIANLADGAAGKAYTLSVEIVVGAGGYTTTLPTNVKWAEGVVPVVGTTPSSIHLYHFLWDGTRWLGIVGGTNFS